MPTFRRRYRIALLGAAVLCLAGLWWLIATTELGRHFTNLGVLLDDIRALGPLGPAVVVVLMAANIVVSPLPSTPIVVAAGAVYGSLVGTFWVLLGAQIGSLMAFFIARRLGAERVQAWLGKRVRLDGEQTQLTLMGIIFASRLVPVLSFDLLSYGAGLTPLTWWRFLIANTLGMVPANFLLAHFGYGALAMEGSGPWLTALGVTAGVAVVVALLLHVKKRRRAATAASDKADC